MTIRKELIDELIATGGGSLIGPDGLVKGLTTALMERMLAGELNHHLGYEKHEVTGYGTGNSRNGTSGKTLKGEAGEVTIKESGLVRTCQIDPAGLAAAAAWIRHRRTMWERRLDRLGELLADSNE